MNKVVSFFKRFFVNKKVTPSATVVRYSNKLSHVRVNIPEDVLKKAATAVNRAPGLSESGMINYYISINCIPNFNLWQRIFRRKHVKKLFDRFWNEYIDFLEVTETKRGISALEDFLCVKRLGEEYEKRKRK